MGLVEKMFIISVPGIFSSIKQDQSCSAAITNYKNVSFFHHNNWLVAWIINMPPTHQDDVFPSKTTTTCALKTPPKDNNLMRSCQSVSDKTSELNLRQFSSECEVFYVQAKRKVFTRQFSHEHQKLQAKNVNFEFRTKIARVTFHYRLDENFKDCN